MIINQCLAFSQAFFEILPFPRICANAVAAAQIATFVAPNIFPIGQSSFSDPQKQEKVEKIKRIVEQVKHKLGLEKLNIEVRISDMLGSEITVLGSAYSLGTPLLIIGSGLIFDAKSEKVQTLPSFQRYQEMLKSIDDENDKVAQEVNVGLRLHKLSKDQQIELFTLNNLYKDILTDDELEVKIAENINQIVSHTALKALSYLGALWSFARSYTSFLRLLSIKGKEFEFAPDNYLETALNFIRKNTYISVPARKLESICRLSLVKWMINSTPSGANTKIIKDSKIFPGRITSSKKNWVSYMGNNDGLILKYAMGSWPFKSALMGVGVLYGTRLIVAIIKERSWGLVAVPASLYALYRLKNTKYVSKVTEYALLSLSLIELTHFMFDNKFVEDQLLNLELKSFSFIQLNYQKTKPWIALIENAIGNRIKAALSW